MEHLRSTGRGRIEALPEAQDEWVDYVNMVGSFTLFPTCNSWYLGANVPGKTRVSMPLLGFPLYKEKCNKVAEDGYEGFALTSCTPDSLLGCVNGHLGREPTPIPCNMRLVPPNGGLNGSAPPVLRP